MRPLIMRGKNVEDLMDILWPTVTVAIFDSEMVSFLP